MTKKLADHLSLVLADRAVTDLRIFVLDGDLADSDGAMHFAKAHPGRFLMAGIAEQNMVSVAAGMADTGLRPWVFSFAAFLCYRAYDQIRICLSQAKQAVTIVASHAGGLAARNGKTHAAPNDLALILSLPSLHVWAPADFADVELAVRSTLQSDAPCYIRMPRRVFGDSEQLPGVAATARWLRPCRSVTIVSTGLATHWALEAVNILAEAGYRVGLLHCPCLNPLPPLFDELRNVERIVVIEDHGRLGGLASLIEQLPLSALVTVFCWPAEFSGKSGSDSELLMHYGLSGQALADAIQDHIIGQ